MVDRERILAKLDEQIVFAAATSRFEDFSRFREEVLAALRNPSNP